MWAMFAYALRSGGSSKLSRYGVEGKPSDRKPTDPTRILAMARLTGEEDENLFSFFDRTAVAVFFP